MSDPVINAEIEDVLSSIRRLVAGDRNDAKSAHAAPDVASVETTDAPRDALVLTPSLRVEEEPPEDEADRWEADADSETGEAPAIGNMSAEDSWETGQATASGADDAPVEADDVDDTVAEAAPFAGDVREALEETDDLPIFVRPLHRPEMPELKAFSHRPLSGKEDDSTKSDSAEDAAISDFPFFHAGRSTPRAGFHFEAIGDEETVDDPQPDPEDPLAEELSGPFAPAETESGGSSVDLADDATIPEPGPDLGEDSFPGDEPALASADPDIVGPEDQQLDPVDDPWGDATDMADAGLDKDLSGHGSPEAGDGTERAANLFSDQALDFDEEALRDLVSEMLHRELQGPLGERITRNVRKLVRREIHRALAARDFD